MPGRILRSSRKELHCFTVALLAIGFLSLASCAAASDYEARVVGIVDGDTVTILFRNVEENIRLAEIDAPEKGQPFGSRSKEMLSDLVYLKIVSVEPVAMDRYGRPVVHIYVDKTNVSAAMLERGAAWVYTAYSDDPSLLQIQATARASKTGLWGLSEYQQVPPWEWRRGSRASNLTSPGAAKYSCDSKMYCKQMTSCDEARWYLLECGLGRLDGDSDGVPCENLCVQ